MAETQRSDSRDYIVVARRYRPQTFTELVGQGQVSQALGNAITTNRVGHAYLFTGARGVGKTSTARIFAKALNCAKGPTPSPCNECDICRSITAGSDVDVLEIDGASNRGVEEIRELRANVGVRPSRSRFKVYIIDEVHMLTREAFNALLKTLEEPPEHVKFIFCTTDPQKMPITVLSRCQRFDFPPVETSSIVDRLKYIVDAEGVEAEMEALQILARRAGGSMRDSQSLLEQLLSFCDGKITVDHVHKMLGTAKTGRLMSMVDRLAGRDAAGALAQLDQAISEGVDVGQLAEQLLGFFRDMMAAMVGCDKHLMLHTHTDDYAKLAELGRGLGLETVLAIVQILDHAIVRMRQSTHVRTLVEMALIRICNLEDLEELSKLISGVQDGSYRPALAAPKPPVAAPPSPSPQVAASPPSPPPPAEKKKVVPDEEMPVYVDEPFVEEAPVQRPAEADVSARVQEAPRTVEPPPPPPPPAPRDEPQATGESVLTPAMAESLWRQALETLGDITADMAGFCSRVAICGPNRLAVGFPPGYTHQKEFCERPERRGKIEQALSQAAGFQIRIDLQTVAGESGSAAVVAEPPKPKLNRMQRMREMQKHPLVQEAVKLFDAEVVKCDEPPSSSEAGEDS